MNNDDHIFASQSSRSLDSSSSKMPIKLTCLGQEHSSFKEIKITWIEI